MVLRPLRAILTDADDIPDLYKPENKVLEDGALSADDLFEAHQAEAESDILIYHWLPAELELVRQLVPTVYHKIAGQQDLDELGHLSEDDLFYRLALQFETRLINESSFLDATITNQWHDPLTLDNKVRRIIKTGFVAFILGLGEPDTNYTQALDKALKDGKIDEFLIDIKKDYIDMYRKLPNWFVETKTERKSANTSLDNLSFVNEVVDLVGRDRVKAIVLYGSASKEKDPALIDDYDCYLVVGDGETSPDLYRTLRQFSFVNSSDGKPVSFNVIEESVFPKFIRMEHDSYEATRRCKVLHGSAEFPLVDGPQDTIEGAVSSQEVIVRGLSHCITRIVSLKAASGSSLKRPEAFNGNEKYFRNYIKTQRFLAQACMNYADGLALRSKKDYEAVIERFGGEMTAYMDNPKDKLYFARALCRAAACSSGVVQNYLRFVSFHMETNPNFTPNTKAIKPNTGMLDLEDFTSAYFLS